MNRQEVSLREAARAWGVTEEHLRRAILSGELPAEPVPDDRQYLIRGAFLREESPWAERSPSRGARRARVILWIVLPLLLLAFLLQGFDDTWDAYCCECGVFLRRHTYLGLPLPFTWVEPGDGTELIRAAYPEPCRHEWRGVEVHRHG